MLYDSLEKTIINQYKESISVFESNDIHELISNLRDLEEGNVNDFEEFKGKIKNLLKDGECDLSGKISNQRYMGFLDEYSVSIYIFSNQKEIIKKFLNVMNEKVTDYFNSITEIFNNKKYELPLNMIESKLLDDNTLEILSKWTNKKLKYENIRLIYKGTKDGFKQDVIYKKCNNQGPTFSLIKSNHNKLFGAFADKPLNGNCDFTKDDKAFIYSISEKTKFEIVENINAFWGFNGDNGGKILYWFGACGNIGKLKKIK